MPTKLTHTDAAYLLRTEPSYLSLSLSLSSVLSVSYYLICRDMFPYICLYIYINVCACVCLFIIGGKCDLALKWVAESVKNDDARPKFQTFTKIRFITKRATG